MKRALPVVASLLLALAGPVRAQRTVSPVPGGSPVSAPLPVGPAATLSGAAPAPISLDLKLSAPQPLAAQAVPAAAPAAAAASRGLAQASGLTLAPSAVAAAARPVASVAGPAVSAWTIGGTARPVRGAAPVTTRQVLDGVATQLRELQGTKDEVLDKTFDGAVSPAQSDLAPADFAGEQGHGGRHAKSYDYARMLDLTRRLLTRPAVRKFLRETFKEDLEVTPEMRKRYSLSKDFEKVKEVSESQFMHVLQNSPELHDRLDEFLAEVEGMNEDTQKYEKVAKAWGAEFREILKDESLRERFRVLNDPLRAFRLEPEGGGPGYSNARIFVNHKSVVDGRELPPSDLKRVVLDFIAGARKEILLNVFDFDLLDVADALVAKAKEGVKVTVGIDKNTAGARPQVQAVVERLKGHANLTVVLVDSVALNHQKLIVTDPDDPKNARTLMSSGNLTQSCIGPEGDLVDVPDRPAYSVPNANHMVTLDGYLAAQAAAHNLRKTLELGLRGDEYPLGGAFKIFGPKPEGAAEPPFVLLTFSPKGALGDINRDVTRRVLLETRGPVRGMYFAASSSEFEAALVLRAKAEKAEGKEPDIKLVGDGSMAVRDWSSLLWLAGWRLESEDDKGKRYLRLGQPVMKRILGQEAFERFEAAIRVAPKPYRVYHYKMPDGTEVEVNAKLHHKVLVSGGLAVLGTSFNFSENANKNQEQFLLTNDPGLVAGITGAFDAMYAMSTTSVADEVARRNEFWNSGGDKDDLTVGNQYRHVDEQAKSARRRGRKS